MKLVPLLLFLLTSSTLIAQTPYDSANIDTTTLVAEHTPTFPGGNYELYRFIEKNIRYPKDARRKGIEGKVFISFIVERDGSIKPESINVENKVYPSLDYEAVRVAKLMPK